MAWSGLEHASLIVLVLNAASRLHPIPPVTRSSLRVGDRDDRDFVLGDDIDDLIRESTDRYPSGTGLFIERSYMRLSSNEGRRLCDAIEEIRSQTRPLLLVPGYGGSEFFASRRKVANPTAHRPRMSRSIRPTASSQDSSSAEPDSRAATRRLISSAHADAASGSAGPSRLATSSLAKSARPFRSKRSASARTVSAAFVMRIRYAAGGRSTSELLPNCRGAAPTMDRLASRLCANPRLGGAW